MNIDKRPYKSHQFMSEMKQLSYEILHAIKSIEKKYKHDSLTTDQCPTIDKFMLKLKT
ncbi:hypothetical protein [Staphylococcus pseudintermedius]|uniref:hypothetical protein n=1 Tax=Staphylococcus pseudintermedius TaxID=283734 RepID=UPI0015F27295|nr:hypothetical protein [Staphylococcus pseudintermedius]